VGKKYLIDNNPETCWTSQQVNHHKFTMSSCLIMPRWLYCKGLPQYIQLGFSTPVIPKRLSLTFQGGFVGTRCLVNVLACSQDTCVDMVKPEWQALTRIYPEDVNRRQIFDLDAHERVQCLKLVFEESSDFFGRITVYDLTLEGHFSEIL
jgi:hypothetical protein